MRDAFLPAVPYAAHTPLRGFLHGRISQKSLKTSLVVNAAKAVVMMDLAVLNAEMAAGLYKKPNRRGGQELRCTPGRYRGLAGRPSPICAGPVSRSGGQAPFPPTEACVV